MSPYKLHRKTQTDLDMGRRPELKSVEFSEITKRVADILTDRFTQAGFPFWRDGYWDFESSFEPGMAVRIGRGGGRERSGGGARRHMLVGTDTRPKLGDID